MSHKRKTRDEFEVQGNYGHGWECVTTEETYKSAREQLKVYRENEPQYQHRLKIVRWRPSGIVAVSDLVGLDIRGLRANVVAEIYRDQYRSCPDRMVKTLIAAEWRMEQGHKWLRLTWERQDYIGDCGFSGWREDGEAFSRTIEIIKG